VFEEIAFVFVFRGRKNNYLVLTPLLLLDGAVLSFCSVEHGEGTFCGELYQGEINVFSFKSNCPELLSK